MTTSFKDLTAPPRGLLVTLRSAIARDEFFALLYYILRCASGFGANAGDWTASGSDRGSRFARSGGRLRRPWRGAAVTEIQASSKKLRENT